MFQFRSKYYNTSFGTAMGNAISPFLADIFMMFFEREMQKSQLFPRIYYRYVDDVYAIVHRRKIQDTLSMLNSSRHPSINFTVEVEKEERLPFLDLWIRRSEDGGVKFSIYRKESWTGRTITSDSFHPRNHKMAAYHSFANRLMTVPMEDVEFQQEWNQIIEIGRRNGYDKNTITRILDKHKRKKDLREVTTLRPADTATEDQVQRRTVPFCDAWSTRMAKLCREKGVEAIPESSAWKIKSSFKSNKDAIESVDKAGVYSLGCQDGCEAIYIGQTRRKIAARMKEHFAHFRKGETERSSVAEHMSTEIHFTNEKKLRLIKEVRNAEHLDMLETLAIKKARSSGAWLMNGDSGPVESVMTKAFD